MTGSGVAAVLVATAVLAVLFYLADRRRDRATARQDDEDALADRARGDGMAPVLALLADRAGEAGAPDQRRHESWRRRHGWWKAVADEANRQLWNGNGWSVAGFVVLPALAVAWGFLFVLQRSLDVRIMIVLGHEPEVAAVLGTAVAVAIAVCGLLITGLVGLDDLLPDRKPARRWVRRTSATVVVGLFLVLAFALPGIAVYRSQAALGDQVVLLDKKLAQEESRVPPVPDRIKAATDDLDAARRRLEVGERLDWTVTVIVPMVELATSFAAVATGVLLLVLLAAGAAGFSGRQAERARHRFEEVVLRTRATARRVAYAARADMGEAERMLRQHLPLVIEPAAEPDDPRELDPPA